MKKRVQIAILLATTVGVAHFAVAQQSGATGMQRSISSLFPSPKENELIEPDQAFKLRVESKGPDSLHAELVPAAGYYLYKDKIRFSLKGSGSNMVTAVKLPPGEMKTDQIFGKTEVYRKAVPIEITLKRAPDSDKVTLVANYQGCHEKLGVCYPPIEKTLSLPLH